MERAKGAERIYGDFMRSQRHLYSFLAFMLGLQAAAQAQHVGIDRSYGENGISKMLGSGTPNDTSEWFNQTRIAPLGDGRAYVFLARGASFSIARFMANGAPDPAFNGGLVLNTPLGIGTCAPDEQSRILCTNTPYSDSQTLQVNVRRYLSNGEPDISFGTGGVSSLSLPNPGHQVGQIGSQAVNQIVRASGATGYLLRVTQSYSVRLTDAGALDITYGAQGMLQPAAGRVVLTVDDAGRQYVASTNDNGATFSRIWRTLPSGAVDATYGDNGSVLVPNLVGSPYEYGTKIGVDGRLYVSFAKFPYGASATSIVRVSNAGAVDSSWGTQGVLTIDPQIGYTRIESVSDAGELLVGSQSPGQSSTATWTFRKFNSLGQPDLPFGGKGVTRIPDETSLGMRIVSLAFDSSSGKILGAGSISNPESGVAAIRLSHTFTHRVRVDSLTSRDPLNNTIRTRIAYMDSLVFGAVTSGDAGPPVQNARVRIGDSTGSSCSFDYGLCMIQPSNVGTFTPTLTHDGDFIYTGTVFAGTPIEVAKATIRVDVSYYSQWWAGQPKLKAYREISPALQPRFLTGTFQLSDGEGSCTIPASAFVGSIFVPHGTAGCHLSHKTPGEKNITVRLLGDPNIEEVVQMGGNMRATVYPAITSGTLTNPNGKQYTFQFTTNDPNCGLISYSGFWSDVVAETANLPLNVRRSQMREGGAAFTSVDDCARGFNAQISIQESSSQRTISASYTRAQDGSFSKVTHSPVGTMSFNATDNGAGDSGTPQRPGELQFVTVFESAASDSVCFVDLREPRKNSLAILLIRFALGFRDMSLVDGTEFGYSEMSYWSEYFSCSVCAAEIDLNGNGIVDLTDGLLLKRWLTEQRSETAIAGGYNAPAGGRSAEQVLSYLQNGCK